MIGKIDSLLTEGVLQKMVAELFMASNSPHIYQCVAGFLALQDSGRIKVSFLKEIKGDKLDLPHGSCLIAYIAGKTLIFDIADGYNAKQNFNFVATLQNVDYYFKRSCSREKNIELLGGTQY